MARAILQWWPNMMTFFRTASASSFVCQMIRFYSLNREVRIRVLSDNMGKATANLSAGVLTVPLTGLTWIVGVAYLFTITAPMILQ
jgi:hypothetical protein